MYKDKIKAFTLVEMIIVVTILAILATIGFLSYQSYTSDARDTARKADIGIIKDVLSLFYIKNTVYPMPSEELKTVTYSGAVLFYEGTFGESVFKEVGKLTSLPKDPLYKNVNYTYSINNTKTQYQIGYITENPLVFQTITNTTLASSKMAQIQGDYSGSILVTTGGLSITYITPSIITASSSTGTIDIEDLTLGAFVEDNEVEKIPFSYASAEIDGYTSFVPESKIIVAFEDDNNLEIVCDNCVEP